MKISAGTIGTQLAIFAWCIFMGVTAVSIVIPVTVGGILTLLAMLFAALGMMSDDGIALTVDRQVLDAEPMPVRAVWYIPAQPPLPAREAYAGDDAPTQIVTVTSLRRPYR